MSALFLEIHCWNNRMKSMTFVFLLLSGAAAADTGARPPMQAVASDSTEARWAAKKVHSARSIDAGRKDLWTLSGSGEMSFPTEAGDPGVRVDVALSGQQGLPVATARRAIPNEDWREYNRLSFWIRTDLAGFPILTLFVTIRDAGIESAAAVHARESTLYVSAPPGKWTLVQWEIPHVRRDRVVSIDFRPWVNKILAEPWDRVAFQVRSIRLERVDPDHYEGWNLSPAAIAYSHTGYLSNARKAAVAPAAGPAEFQIVRVPGDDIALSKRATPIRTRIGGFRVFDFSELSSPGTYVIRSGELRTRPFHIGAGVWLPAIAKTLNFFYGERCGIEVPGVHEACHRDWRAREGERSIVMNGGWHDAGDLSQGLVNTGEATHAMFALAGELRKTGRSPELLRLLEQEAKWGLDWIHKVRFPGGFRIGFASMNIWTNGIIGDADDRTAVALNNPNVNYLAAAAGAAAYNYLKDAEPLLAKKSLAIAEEDWKHAITGVEAPETRSTPAFAATEMELASVGIIASLELYRATGKIDYSRKARELSTIVTGSQQRRYIGTQFPLAGFFYTGPDRRKLFHQFHRGNDQAPVVAMTMLCNALPDDPEWMNWYATATLYAEYQKRAVSATEPYQVLPAYLYREADWQTIEEGDRYGSNRESYRKQVLSGMPVGDGHYLRAFPVWFTRRGNYGVLLSQAKGLSAASRLRNDQSGIDLAERQLQWVAGLNPFAQSTMWGEGYDFAPQYSVSVGDLVGSLPVGMMTFEDRDAPYWPATNAYVFKEVWVHPSARWLAVVADLVAAQRAPALHYTVTAETRNDAVLISVTARGSGRHTFELRTHNLQAEGSATEAVLQPGVPATLTWKARVQSPDEPWVAAVIADRDASGIRDVAGFTKQPDK